MSNPRKIRRPATLPAPSAVADIVKAFTAARGYPPLIREVGAALGVDKHVALRVVTAAEGAGVIERRQGLPRTIRVVDRARRAAR